MQKKRLSRIIPPKKNMTGNFWEPEMSLDVFSTYK